jgi:hypothetical protein
MTVGRSWQCDRCGFQTEPTIPPKGWASYTTNENYQGHLCDDCTIAFKGFLETCEHIVLQNYVP